MGLHSMVRLQWASGGWKLNYCIKDDLCNTSKEHYGTIKDSLLDSGEKPTGVYQNNKFFQNPIHKNVPSETCCVVLQGSTAKKYGTLNIVLYPKGSISDYSVKHLLKEWWSWLPEVYSSV